MLAHHDLKMWSPPAGSPKELVPSVQHFCVNVKVAKINHVIIQTCGLVGVKKKGCSVGVLASSGLSTVSSQHGHTKGRCQTQHGEVAGEH